ncbi:MAG: hypothetical protein LBV52_03620 [Spirochaetaceae bacterium]|jgi:hypothetical protein|nr:hypothetical protein [Spirochaetaceae bacterium]
MSREFKRKKTPEISLEKIVKQMYLINDLMHACSESDDHSFDECFEQIGPLCKMASTILFHEVMERFDLSSGFEGFNENTILMYLDQVFLFEFPDEELAAPRGENDLFLGLKKSVLDIIITLIEANRDKPDNPESVRIKMRYIWIGLMYNTTYKFNDGTTIKEVYENMHENFTQSKIDSKKETL